MSRIKFLIQLFVLAVILLWPLPVTAQDSEIDVTCLPNCYASETTLPGKSTPGDGTSLAPWIAKDDEEKLALRTAVSVAAKDEEISASLALITCDANGQNCSRILCEYDEDGLESCHAKASIPDVGVPLPFPYVLGGGVLFGVLLISSGLILRRRARRLNA